MSRNINSDLKSLKKIIKNWLDIIKIKKRKKTKQNKLVCWLDQHAMLYRVSIRYCTISAGDWYHFCLSCFGYYACNMDVKECWQTFILLRWLWIYEQLYCHFASEWTKSNIYIVVRMRNYPLYYYDILYYLFIIHQKIIILFVVLFRLKYKILIN